MKILNTMLAIALTLSLAGATMAQGNGSSANGVPNVVIESLTHDFGEIKSGVPISHSFKIKNTGSAELKIYSVSPG